MEENKEGTVNYIYVQNEDSNLKRRVKALENFSLLSALFAGITCYGFYVIGKYLSKNNSSKEDTTKGE